MAKKQRTANRNGSTNNSTSPETANLKVSLSSFNIFLKELLKIEPSLRNNKIINDVSKKPFTGNFYADGTFANIEIFNSKVLWGKSTQVYVNGILENVTNPDKIAFNIPDFKAETIKKDLLVFDPSKNIGVVVFFATLSFFHKYKYHKESTFNFLNTTSIAFYVG